MSRNFPARDDPPAAQNQSSMTYQQLRSEIVSGLLVPGERLKVNEIASRFAVSPGAVREALSRLVPERLVVSRDQKGFLVAPLYREDLEDLTDLRCTIEAIALRRSVQNATLEWEAGIIASAHRLKGTPRLTSGNPVSLNPEWTRSHEAFHASLVAACGSKRLLELHHQLYEQSERYRGLSVVKESGRNVDDEHVRITTAALARDADRLVDEVTTHIKLTTQLILKAE